MDWFSAGGIGLLMYYCAGWNVMNVVDDQNMGLRSVGKGLT